MSPAKPLGSAIHDFSTESRSQFVLRDPALLPAAPPTGGPSAKPAITSTMKAHPWSTGMPALQQPAWAGTWAHVGMPAANHFATTSSVIGSLEQPPLYSFPIMQRAKDAQNVRYLQAPYLPNGAEYFEGKRPTSSSTTHAIFSGAEAALMNGAEQRFAERMGATAAFAKSRASTGSLTPVPDEWLTSNRADYYLRPPADIQQHRLRGFTTSKHLAGHPLHSTPQRCVTAPLLGSTVLHTQQYVGMRDPDGSRRLMEVAQAGAPPPPELPKPAAPPGHIEFRAYISSQPKTTSHSAQEDMDPSLINSFSGMLDDIRKPWPKEINDSTQNRRPFAMGYHHGLQHYEDYKTVNCQAQAAKFAA